ncbi:MAG TPA: lipoyl synthase [Thermoanaerobaculia bacterium]|nr:lipoyl synthase [Thermoanaerobaculia bacterium]
MTALRPLPARGEPALPPWIREKKLRLGELHSVKAAMRRRGLSTVCEEARCPNRTECFERKTATFLIAGDVCTRACGFCHISSGRPPPLDPKEPQRLVSAARELGLHFVVVTSVDRDDLPDGGSRHWARVVRALKEDDPSRGVEVLTPDFQGIAEQIDEVAGAGPDVYNHNVETVPRLYATVRSRSEFQRSVALLARVKEGHPEMTTKSGLMLGLGERDEEVLEVFRKLRAAYVDIVTVGQYLRPSAWNLPVVEYAIPERFEALRRAGGEMGFAEVFAGPFVRSSYRAEEALSRAVSLPSR